MKIRLSLAAAAFLAVLLSSVEAQVEPPSDLRFKILNENTVQMTWNVPLTRIEGFKIQVASDTDEPTKHVSLPATATKTSITDLTTDKDYVVTIIAYSGSEESLPISGKLTIHSSGTELGGPRKPQVTDSVKCSFSAVTDLVFLVDGSWSAGRDFKYIRNFISAMAGAFEIGEDKTRVGVVQYSTDTKTEFNLNQHVKWGELLRAINTLPYKGGNTMTGEAMDYLLKNTFTEANGARKGFPKVAMIITDGKSQDPVENIAKKLKNMGVEIFTLGIKGADEDELKQMASTPYRTHVYNILNFDLIKNVQKELITHVCSGVDDQLNSLVSGEEVIEPASNLRVMEMASKSMRVTWDISFGDVSGYKLQLIPMMAGSKRHELYVGASQTSVMVTGLSPDTEYQISLFALKGLTPSEPIITMEKTEPVKVSLECSLGVDVQADVVILVDGSYSIGLSNFAKVRAFLEVLVNSFDIGQDKIQISLVQYSRDAHTEFYLNTHHDMSAVVNAVRTFPYRGGSTNTGRAMTYVREKIFLTTRGSRPNVPRVTILITDGKSSDSFKDPATNLKKADVEIFAVGVKDAVRSELEAIATEPVETHVYTVEDFDAFQRISKELTQAICLRIEQELLNIRKKSLLPPRLLTFSEVAARSFRATWETDALNVLSYLIQFRPAADVNGDFVSMSLPGDMLTTLLPHLTPLTHYEVNVFAQYTEGDSFPLNGFETTLDEQGPVRNLRVSEETTDSFRVSWAAAPGAVVRYRLTYVPVRGDSTRLETATVGDETTIVLPELFPLTTYRVMVAAEYQSGAGAEMKIDGTTKEALGSPRDLQVFDQTVSTMRLSWAAAPGRVLQYRIIFRPSAGGEKKEVSVKGGNTNTLLKDLLPGTEYDLAVSARYSSGLGDPLEGKGTTLEELGSPKDLVTSDVTDTSFAASWMAAPGNVKMYRIRWKSLYSDESGEKTVPGDVTNTVLDGLTPETLYQVSVVASYGRGDGDPLTGQETTDVSAAAKALTVSDETERSMKITWMAAPGKVINYRVTYVPTDGGKEMFAKVPGTSTSTVLKRLTPMTIYDITVHPIYKRGEGKARQGVGTTLSPYKAPRNLKTSDPGKTSFRVSWDAAPGDVRGYKVTFHPSGNDIDLGELLVGPYDNTVVLEELRAGTKYSVAVFGMFDGGHSAALAGEEKTTLSDAPEVPLEPWNEAKCKSQAKADIILLVDGSWSIGRLNFKTIRAFIARIVGVFDINPDRVMIGMVQYSGDPKTEWHLNAHPTRDGLLKAVADLPYKGGNTMTGMALNYILTNNFKTNVGLRKDSRKIGVLITDGKSQDEIITNSQVLRDENIELYAIGVKNADENELRSIASDPDEIHMYNVNDFSFLLDIVDELTINLCNSVKGPGGLDPPTNLVTSEVTHHSFRATWTGPEGPVEKFRVDYMPVVGGITEQMIVDGAVTTVVLTKLTPLTEYVINVFSVTGGETSEEPLKGTETTLPLPGVIKLTVYDETMTTFKVRWEKAEGATGYMLLYRAINATVPTVEKEVRVGADVNDVQLKDLITDTAYTLTLFALHGVAASNPLIDQGVTLPLPPSGNLRITGVTHSAMKLRWDASPGKVLKYIITYKPEEGELKEVEVNGDITYLPLTNLISQSEYDVAVTPVYDEGIGNSMLGQAITDVVPAPQNLKLSEVTQTSFRATWEHGAPDVALYRIGWTKKGENNFQYSILNSDETSHNLENLDPDTLYDVTVTAIYPDESESEDLIGSQRTSPTGPPQNLQVFNATTVTLTVKWDHAPGPVQNYKISFQPVAGGKALSTQVGGKKNSVILQKLTPDTPYSVTVAAIYPSGEAKDISGRGKTKPLGGVKNLQVINPTMTTLNVKWEAADGKVKEYKVIYVPAAGGAESMETVDATSTTTVLKGLLPDTLYTVSLVPVYEVGDGQKQSENEKTRPLGGVRNLQVTNPTMTTLNVKWEPADGKVKEYNVFYVPAAGGAAEAMETVDATATTTILKGLLPDTLYTVSLVPVYEVGDGQKQSENEKTRPLGGVRNLQITNPTMTTLNVRWEPAEGKVKEYKVLYVPAAGGGAEAMETVDATSTTTVLKGLLPDTLYTVSLVPVYEVGDGQKQSENEKTKPLGGVKNLQVTNPTMVTLNVKWDAAEGKVKEYKVIYAPAAGGAESMETVAGTNTVLKGLTSDTIYTVSVVPVYEVGDGKKMSENGKTRPLGGVKNLQVINPTMTTLNVRWEPADGKVKEYKVFYVPAAGGAAEAMETVAATATSTVLRGLQPDTLYTVSLVPVFTETEGRRQSENGKTRPLGGVKNLKVTEATMTSLKVDWDPADGAVRQYKIFFVPVAGGTPEEMEQVPGSTTAIVLRNLKPDTPYTISVLPIYPVRDGKRQSENGKTLPLGGVTNLQVTNPTHTTLTTSWDAADGNVQGYKVIYTPVAGGLEIVEEVSESTTTTVLKSLSPNTQYRVTVLPVYPEGDGQTQTKDGTTKPLGFVKNLQVIEPTTSTLNVRWDAAEGNVREYIIVYIPTAGGEQEVDQVSGTTTTTVLKELNPDTEYTVTVVPVYHEMEGLSRSQNGKTNPLGGVKNMKVIDPTINSLSVRWDPAVGNVRNYKVFYVAQPDGKEQMEQVSGGTNNLILRNLESDTQYNVSVVPVYPDVDGIMQSEMGKTKPLGGVKNLQVTDPTTNSLRVRWEPAEGDVRQYTVIYAPLAGGPELTTTVSGMSTNTVLRNLVPDTEYKVTLVPMYGDIEGKRTSENGKTKALGGVKNLQVIDPTTSSLKVRWEPAEGNVRQYRLFYVPASGGAEDMEQVSGGTTSTVLRNLLSDTPYTITVVPVYPEGEGLRQSETGKTLPRTPPKNVQVYNPTTNSLNVRWAPASGQVQQYRVIYTPLSGERPAETVLVPGNINNAFLDSLIPDTPYSVSVLALYADGEGPPVKGDGKTLPRAGPRNLRVFDATTNTLTIGWDHAEGTVQQYKIAYAPTTGDPITEFTVVPGNRNNAILQNLLPDTPYNITVEAIYADGAGGSLNGPGRTVGLLEPRNLRVSDEWYTRFRVAWDPSPSPVLGYKLVYTPAEEDQSKSLDVFVGDVTSYTLQNLLPGTTYDVKVFAQYDAGMSGALEGQGTTLYLNVTNLETYNVGFDKFCVKWSPHRAATSYRIKLNPLDPSSKGQQEITITAAQSQYCFKGLSPDALYSATVFVQTPNLEGPGVSTKERTLVKPTEAPTPPPTPPPPPTIPPAWAVCKGAKADVVFLIDGSWSIGEDSFRKVVQFVFSMIGAFDVIGSTGMQVSFVQYSDEAKTEFRLNSYSDKGNALAALQLIQYRGGNTKTGAALMHVKEKVFAPENGMRRNVPKVVVAVTDGRSQDEVKKNAATLQHAGYSVFVVGVADVDFAELQNIGSKPSDRHIFVVDDFDAFATIQDNLVTFICETATSSCPLIYLNGFTSPGFRMLEAFNLTEKTYGYIKGVSMEPGSFNSYTAYRLHKNSFLTQPTTEIHPDGLPHSYTIIMMFRLLPDTPNEAFDIWQVSTKDDKPEVGVTIDPSSQTISYYNKDTRGEIQRVTFDNDQVKRIFHGSFHKLHILVSPTNVKLNLDCQEVADKEIKEAGNTSTDGYQVLGKMSKSIGSKGESATFQLQMFDIVCTLGWTSRDRCCDLPSMREESKCPSLPNACTCTSESTGPQGTQGAVGAPGSKGPRGERGETGPAGPIGPRGDTGLPGPMGLPGPQGSSGLSIPGEAGRQGPKGEAGDSGLPGQKGPPGIAGTTGPIGPAGPRGPQGKEGQAGSRGPTGPMGPPGSPGMPGVSGKPGKPGDTGVSGANGIKGDRGERGDFAPQNMMRSIARQVCEQIVNGQMSRVNSMLNQIPSGYRSSNNPGPPGPAGPSGNQGPRGEPGQAGRNGFPGSSGQPGQQGERGPAGEKGDRGSAAVGQRGQRGPPGPTGEARTGPPGPAGSSGPRGPPGRQGFTGIRGQPGTPGYCDSSQCVSIPYNGQGYRDPYPPEPETYVVPIPEEEDDSQNERRKRSLSRMESKSMGS
nr:collagen alpha-1(XII) chain-like isoform X2 [Oncorhynchus nerka]